MAESSEIRVRILQLGRQVVDYHGQPGQTVAAALAATGMQLGPGMDLRVNGVAADGSTPLRDGDVVTIIPRIKGGVPYRDPPPTAVGEGLPPRPAHRARGAGG